jgi:tetratricopeptide (TPR) repeat protein
LRFRFPTWAVVALGALAAGALGIAASLAVSDADHWPGWLRPYHRWGWPAVWVLLLAAAALAAWQATRQPGPAAGTANPRVRGEDSGPVAARDVTIIGGQGPTAGRDAHTVTGGMGPTAGRDVITNITNVTAPPADPDRAGQEAPVGPVSNLPPRNYAFTGRAELLDRLHQQLTATIVDAIAVTALLAGPSAEAAAGADAAPRVLHGLGGVGKTHLALEYAHRHPGEYPIRWWVTAEQPAAVPGQLAALARQLGIPDHADQTETVAALRAELGRRGGWLLVFDNAEDPHDLQPYWPPTEAGGRVLITSRNPHWQPLAATLPVDVLPRQDAVAFLQRRVGLDKADANRLTEALGDLPLALEQASAYLEQTHTPPAEYLELLAARTWELFSVDHPATSEQTIATTWKVSLERVRAQGPAAEELLTLCAFMAPDEIPRQLFADHPDVLPELLAAAVRDRLAYQQALAVLDRFSLVTITDRSLSVHRLLQTVVRHHLDPATRTSRLGTAVSLLAAAFPQDADKHPDIWPVCSTLLPHALALTSEEDPGMPSQASTALGDLLHRSGWYLYVRARYAEARILLERAVALAEAGFGADHEITGTRLTHLGWLLTKSDELASAGTILERALAINEARLGADHPHTATSLNASAGITFLQGDLDRARTLYERALSIREARLGADHPNTATSLNNLANALRAQGDPDAARRLHERALRIREDRLGADHPDTAQSLNNLANALRAQGDPDAARALHKRALAIREQRFGPDHPDTASSLHNLARDLRDQGDLDQARALYERALSIREARLGADHPDTATSLNNLANVLRDQGDLQGARVLHERALAIREARLGADHPDTVHSRHDLAAVVAARDAQR